MDKIDSRQLSTELQQYNRDQAIRLYLEGMSRKDIIQVIGVHPSTLGLWITAYKKGGMEALKIGRRGRREGEGRRLSAPQEKN